jgi:hypothetical protein
LGTFGTAIPHIYFDRSPQAGTVTAGTPGRRDFAAKQAFEMARILTLAISATDSRTGKTGARIGRAHPRNGFTHFKERREIGLAAIPIAVDANMKIRQIALSSAVICAERCPPSLNPVRG